MDPPSALSLTFYPRVPIESFSSEIGGMESSHLLPGSPLHFPATFVVS